MKISVKFFILAIFLFSFVSAFFLFLQKNNFKEDVVSSNNPLSSKPKEDIVSSSNPLSSKPIVTTEKTIILAKTSKIPKSPPILRINQGGHTALIRKIIYTADGNYLISASEDKTIRVWNLKTGKTERIIRGQIGAGSEGKLLAMALSPDEQWLAVAGELAGTTEEKYGIRLYHFSTGRLQTLLKGGHSNLILSLDFSPDSKLLVSGSKDKNAVIWDIKTEQAKFTLKGHKGAIYAVKFTLDGQKIVTGSDDNLLKLWQANNGQLVNTLVKHQDKIRSIAISKDYIASGSYDKTINLWNVQTGEWLKTLVTQKSRVHGLNFNKEGTQIVSGFASLPLEVSVYDVFSGKKISTYTGHDNIVLTSTISPDSHWVASAGGNKQEIHIWNLKTGKLKQRLGGLGQSIFSVAFSKDGKSLAWGKTPIDNPINPAINRGALEYKIRLPITGEVLGTPIDLVDKETNFQRAIIQQNKWSLSAPIKGNERYPTILYIKENQETRTTITKDKTNGYLYKAYTFTPDGNIITAAGRGFLTLYKKNGEKIGDFIGHSGDIWAVAVSPDGKLLASGSSDQTVRLWNIQTQELLVTLFHGNNDEWIIWTPNGYYASSTNGDNLIGWQINKGATKTPDYVSSAQLKKSHYRPDIINKAIRLGSVDKAIKGVLNLEKIQIADLTEKTPPKFSIINHKNGEIVNSRKIDLTLKLAKNSQQPDNVDLTINNRHISKKGKKKKIIIPSTTTSVNEKNLYKTGLSLDNGENTVKIKVKNAIGETTKTIKLIYNDPKPALEPLGNLYIIAIGVGKYNSQSFEDLIYAPDDAKKIAKFFEQQQGKRFKKVYSRILVDGAKLEPTAQNIKQALKLFENATENDTSILFISGHGENAKDDNYYYLLKGVSETSSGGYTDSTSIKWDTFRTALESAAGIRVVMIDACYAGNAFNSRAQKDSLDQDIIFMTATNAYTQAEQDDSKDIRQGVFTWALLRGLSKMADTMPKDKQIEYEELRSHVIYEVKEHTHKNQIPVIKKPDDNDTREIFFANL